MFDDNSITSDFEDIVIILFLIGFGLITPLGLKEWKLKEKEEEKKMYIIEVIIKLTIYVIFILTAIHIILVVTMPKGLESDELSSKLNDVGFNWYLLTILIVCIPIIIKTIIKKSKQYRIFSSILIIGIMSLTTIYYYIFFPFSKIVNFWYNLRWGENIGEETISDGNEIPFKYPYFLGVLLLLSILFYILIALKSFNHKVQKKVNVVGYVIIYTTLLLTLIFWLIK